VTPLPAPPRRALVIALRYLGDVLLATPVAGALKRLYPQCKIDMLVFLGSEGMLEGNPDLEQVLTTREGASTAERLAQMAVLWRRYDLAVVTSPGDPPVLFGFAAARRRIGFVPAASSSRRWKQALLARWADFDPLLPRIEQNDRLAQLLGAERAGDVVTPSAGIGVGAWLPRLGFDPARERFAIVHPSPRWRYKRWTAEGWRALVVHLRSRVARIVITGGASEAERAYIDSLALGEERLLRADGRLRLAEVADLLRLSSVFVGPDTSTTHLAAACGTPTVALYGPTDPVIWGPTPGAVDRRPYARVAARQRRGKVLLLQNPELSCVPCQLEGCDRHRDSRSECLDRLSPERVIEAVDLLLAQALAEPG
jgi:heptosyltransferase-3